MADQLEQVWPLDPVASRKHKRWSLQRCDLVNLILSLIGAEFHGMPIWLCRGAAMDTGEVAGLGHFPDGDEGSFVEINRIDLRVHGPIRLRRGSFAQ